MRSKNILSIVAFIAAFGFSAAFASLFIGERVPATMSYTLDSGSNYKSYCRFKKTKNLNGLEVLKLIAEDRANFRAPGKKMYSFYNEAPTRKDAAKFAQYAVTVETYVNDSDNLEVENLPADFAFAWKEHVSAWRDYSDYLNRVANDFNTDLPSAEDYKQADRDYNEEITRTWMNVLRIGRSYDSDVR